MRILHSSLTAAIAVSLISACSGNSAGTSALGLPPQPSTQSQLGLSHDLVVPGPLSTPAPQDSYVANAVGNTITVYDSAATTLECTIGGSTSQLSDPDAIAFDNGVDVYAGDLYVANRKSSQVTAYQACKAKPVRTIGAADGVSKPTAIAVTKAGYLYVANASASPPSVTIYQPGSPTPVQTLTQNIVNPQALAFDSTGVLYVANGKTSAHPNGSVAVCSGSPPARACTKTLVPSILAPIDNPRALAVDASNNVYVANDVDVMSGSVTKCASYPGNVCSPTPIGSSYLRAPNALVIDTNNHLCVSSYGNNEVVCFNPTSYASLWKIIQPSPGNIQRPVGLAVGQVSGWLKVVNNGPGNGSLTQYCPLVTCVSDPTPMTTGMNGPSSIAISQ